MDTGRSPSTLQCQQIWRTPVEYERGAARVGQPGVIMRGGATIYDGKLFRETIDCHVVALDMKTGKEIWRQKFADYKEGYTGIIAPLVANGVVITGVAGGDRTTRGFLDGWEPETGKKICPTHGNTAVGRLGRTVHMTRSLTSSIGARAMRSRTTLPIVAALTV